MPSYRARLDFEADIIVHCGRRPLAGGTGFWASARNFSRVRSTSLFCRQSRHPESAVERFDTADGILGRWLTASSIANRCSSRRRSMRVARSFMRALRSSRDAWPSRPCRPRTAASPGCPADAIVEWATCRAGAGVDVAADCPDFLLLAAPLDDR